MANLHPCSPRPVRQFKWRMSFDGANNKDRDGLQDAYNEAENIYQERVNHGASARHEEIYGFSWIVLLVMVLLFKLFTATPRKSTALPTFVRFLQGLLAIGIIAAIACLIGFTNFTIADLFASALAFLATGWCILCLAITWKRVVKTLGLWDSVHEISRMYDAGMGAVIFAPIVFFSWFPFVSTFQSRILFNQAFSRGLEISLILAGNKANQES